MLQISKCVCAIRDCNMTLRIYQLTHFICSTVNTNGYRSEITIHKIDQYNILIRSWLEELQSIITNQLICFVDGIEFPLLLQIKCFFMNDVAFYIVSICPLTRSYSYTLFKFIKLNTFIIASKFIYSAARYCKSSALQITL